LYEKEEEENKLQEDNRTTMWIDNLGQHIELLWKTLKKIDIVKDKGNINSVYKNQNPNIITGNEWIRIIIKNR
jgi:hypothetical protein